MRLFVHRSHVLFDTSPAQIQFPVTRGAFRSVPESLRALNSKPLMLVVCELHKARENDSMMNSSRFVSRIIPGPPGHGDLYPAMLGLDTQEYREVSGSICLWLEVEAFGFGVSGTAFRA